MSDQQKSGKCLCTEAESKYWEIQTDRKETQLLKTHVHRVASSVIFYRRITIFGHLIPTAGQDTHTHTHNMYHSVRPRSSDNAHNKTYVHPATIKVNLEVKLKLHLSIIKHHVMKSHGGAEA